MLRLYLTNDSYPELRDLRKQWARTTTWWRAIGRATRHASFWRFAATQLAIIGALVALDVLLIVLADLRGAAATATHTVVFGLGLGVFGYLQVSWGGDMMRSHLRAVSKVARYACPKCGQSLVGHLDDGTGPVRCPECAALVERDLFDLPHRIPPQFRVFPPWRRRWLGEDP